MSAVTLPTDVDLVADLRAYGFVGPISDDFLAQYRHERDFFVAAKKLEDIPDGLGKFKRALIRVGIIAPDLNDDLPLLIAWKGFQAAERDIEATGPDAPEELDAPAWAAWDAAAAVLEIEPATTIDGAIVKLRRALLLTSPDRWVTDAIRDDDDTTLFARAEDLDTAARLIVDALAALMLVRAESADGEKPSC